ncbi:MAG: dihydrolipoyl dehydrogenase [Methylococcaceae bacterium]|nr:dihydrolipoyl dehydrogenase [Methylococcaceae bacterium]
MLKIRAHYDVIIVGSGPSAISSALKCAEHGMKVLCVDNFPPSSNKLSRGKFSHAPSEEIATLLHSAKLYSELKINSRFHGIVAENISLNLSQFVERKNSIFTQIEKEIYKSFNTAEIDFFNASAKLIASNAVMLSYSTAEPSKLVNAGNIILATESIPISIQCAPVDYQSIYDSSTAFNLTEIPQRIAILGAGVIGLEIACIWNHLGAEVILLDAQESFLSLVDHQISREAYKVFCAQGLELRLGTRVVSTKIINKKVHIEYQDSDGVHVIRVDKLIVASGRKPYSEHLASPEANLLIDQNQFIFVNDNCRTNLPNVYAIGDLTMLGPMLPQKGIAEGIYVADQIAGIQSSVVNYETIPNVIYTDPEIAWVGQTEQSLKAKGGAIAIGTAHLGYSAINKSSNYTQGLVKVISCPKSDTIKGIHIFGNNASDLVAEGVLAMEFSSTTEDLAKTSHSHPSPSEAFRYACQYINWK